MIEIGSIWLEHRTGRRVRIIAGGDESSPAWTYIDDAGDAVPHGHEPANGHTYGDWYTHRCDTLDFVVFGRFSPEGAS